MTARKQKSAAPAQIELEEIQITIFIQGGGSRQISALEVPGSAGALAVHPSLENPEVFSLTHVPGGAAAPAPPNGWSTREVALAYARAFIAEADAIGVDLSRPNIFVGLEPGEIMRLRNVFYRDVRA